MSSPNTTSLRQRLRNLAIGEAVEVSAEVYKRSVAKQTAYNVAKDYGGKYRTTLTAAGLTITRVS